MKSIIQGTYDYLRDCLHDIFNRWDFHWKEGNLFHYIYQRKVSNKLKKAR